MIMIIKRANVLCLSLTHLELVWFMLPVIHTISDIFTINIISVGEIFDFVLKTDKSKMKYSWTKRTQTDIVKTMTFGLN